MQTNLKKKSLLHFDSINAMQNSQQIKCSNRCDGSSHQIPFPHKLFANIYSFQLKIFIHPHAHDSIPEALQVKKGVTVKYSIKNMKSELSFIHSLLLLSLSGLCKSLFSLLTTLIPGILSTTIFLHAHDNFPKHLLSLT